MTHDTAGGVGGVSPTGTLGMGQPSKRSRLWDTFGSVIAHPYPSLRAQCGAHWFDEAGALIRVPGDDVSATVWAHVLGGSHAHPS